MGPHGAPTALGSGETFVNFFPKFGPARSAKKFREIWAAPGGVRAALGLVAAWLGLWRPG